MVFTEQSIDVFEGTVGGLGIEEIDDGDEGGVEYRPDDIEFPLQGLDTDGGYFYDHEVEGPITVKRE